MEITVRDVLYGLGSPVAPPGACSILSSVALYRELLHTTLSLPKGFLKLPSLRLQEEGTKITVAIEVVRCEVAYNYSPVSSRLHLLLYVLLAACASIFAA